MATQKPSAAGMRIAQIFLIESSFRQCSDAFELDPTTKADVGEVKVEIETLVLNDHTQAVLRLAVATDPDRTPEPTYHFRVAYAAFIQLVDATAPVDTPMLTAAGIGFLFPFVRECVANLTQRGRFGPIWIHPIDPRRIVEAARRQGVNPPKRKSRKKGATVPP